MEPDLMLTFALEAFKKIVRAEKRIEKARKDLESYLMKLSPEDFAKYEKTTRLWEQGQ